MSKVLELNIRDGKSVTFSATANVPDDFERELLDAYRRYYADVADDDDALFLRIVRGLYEGIMNNIAAAQAEAMNVSERPVRPLQMRGRRPGSNGTSAVELVEEEGSDA